VTPLAPRETPPPEGSVITPPRRGPILKRGLALAAITVLSLFIVTKGVELWLEWSKLQRQLERVRTTAIVGYTGIQPRFSYADRPNDWFREEGDQALLWSGWREGVGHTWFRIARNEINRTALSTPIGRDVHLAIDHPLIESNNGPIASRIPEDSDVVGHRLAGVETAYPVLVLTKVLVVNDVIEDQPFLVTFFRAGPIAERATIYEPVLDGQRITMGLAGFLSEGRTVLYDRGTESFWTADGQVLRAFAGKHKGRTLNKVGQLSQLGWGLWRSRHPKGRVVVGADRSLAIPRL
jgi:hypothetical protein